MDLSYFVGKACSIFTTPINRTFTEKQLIDHFVCFVEAVDDKGVLGRHPVSGGKNFYGIAHIVAIIEEEVVHKPPLGLPDIMDAKPNKSPMTDYVNTNSLEDLAQKAKSLGQKIPR
jgi:hypothetical protein